MATPIPKAKPVSSGMASIVGVLVVLLLVGAEENKRQNAASQKQMIAAIDLP